MAHRQILLVDDNPVQAATRKIILERTGAAVRVANSGIQALDILDTQDVPPVDLLITDHLMPGMNGPELVNAVRGRQIALPIVVLSGLPDAEQQYEGLHIVFRLKPFHPDALIALVHEQLEEPPMQRTA